MGNQPRKLIDLLPKDGKVAVITNAADYRDEAGIIERLDQEINLFKSHGLIADRLDLREYFGDVLNSLYKRLKQYDLVWVRGGNSFVLRRAMRQSGFDEIIVDMLAGDEIVYGGYSAGACVMTPTLLGIDLCDDPNIIPEGYDQEIIWDGLGLVDYSIVPHYKSDHPESAVLDETAYFLEDRGMPHKTLRDGEALLVVDDQVEFLQ